MSAYNTQVDLNLSGLSSNELGFAPSMSQQNFTQGNMQRLYTNNSDLVEHKLVIPPQGGLPRGQSH